MAEIHGEFSKHTEECKENRPKKKKAKKLKRKLRNTKYELRFQKKLNKECAKRCKAEAELKFIRLLLQNNGDLSDYILHKRK